MTFSNAFQLSASLEGVKTEHVLLAGVLRNEMEADEVARCIGCQWKSDSVDGASREERITVMPQTINALLQSDR